MMNVFKQACLGLVCMITACAAPQRAALESQQQKTPSPITSTTRPPTATTTIASAVLKSPASLSSWNISGAMAAKRNKKGWTATVNWIQQGPNQYQIRLFGPLGGGTILIAKHGALVTYTDGPKKKTSTMAEDLLQKETGMRLPVNNLYYWIRGIAAPGPTQSTQRDSNNNLISLNQGGYTISYTEYSTVNGMNLPRKIRLQGSGVLIKLFIKQWII